MSLFLQGYLCEPTVSGVRIAAVHCTIRLLIPFVVLLQHIGDEHQLRQQTVELIQKTLHRLLQVGVSDLGRFDISQ